MGNLAECPAPNEESDTNESLAYRAKKITSCLKGSKARQVIVACMIGTMLAGGSIYSYNYRNTGYAVKYDGKLLGYVRNKDAALNAIESAKEEIKELDPTIDLSGNTEFKKQLVSKDLITSPDTIKDDIKSGLYIQYTAYAILLNNSEVAVVKSEDDANKVIEGVKKYYEDNERNSGASEVLSVNIKDDLKTVKKVADTSKIIDVQEAIDLLTGGKGTTKKYVVEQGDTIWKIAKDNGVSLENIAALNAGCDMDKLQIGQTINLSDSEPYLNVETTVKVAADENIPYDTKYVNDSNLYKGQTKVVESGQYGINKIVREIKKLNGKEVASSVISSALVKDPVSRVLAKGTKNLAGTGKFLWPTSGHVSSPFGYRGREFHEGLDIAAPMGTPICAADSGTVVHSGRYAGYGNLIIINHGNGYQTYYGHCSKLYVSAGQSVQRGQKIGAVGMTGQATGPHCHFEVRVNGVQQNPLKYLK